MAKMNGLVWAWGRNVLPVVLCLSIFQLRGTNAQSTGLNETQVSNIIRQGLNEIQQPGQEFVTNLFTDLAPLLILLGDQVVRQYMAQSQDWADHILFAVGPLGIAAALSGAVRMCGQKYLRGVVGRGRETRQMAEFELTSATSEDVYEVWDGESIVRVMGEHTFQEIRLQKEGEKVVIEQLFNGMTNTDTHVPIWKRWSDKKNGRKPTSTHVLAGGSEKTPANDEEIQDEVSLDRRKFRMGPNLSLNAIPSDIARSEKWICVGISVLLQIFVITWAALIQYKLPAPRFRKDGRMGGFRPYAFPCMAVGTMSVMASMLLCSYVVDKAMERALWKPKSKSVEWRPCWIQKWGKADDQSFDSYLIFGSLRNTQNPRALMTLHPRRQQDYSELAGHLSEREIPQFLVHLTAVACVLGIGGFFVMVAGIRALHWSVAATQFGQVLSMVLLRAFVRRKMNADDIRAVKLPRGFEMEWVVTRRDELWEKLKAWEESGAPDERDLFWKPEASRKWSLVTGEKIIRGEEISRERGSIHVGSTLPVISREEIIKFETLETLDEDRNPKPKLNAQRALNELKALLHSNKKWEGNCSGLANALAKTMVFTLSTLLPPAVMDLNPPLNSAIGLVNSAPGPTQQARAQPWPNGAMGRVWHWPLVVQMEVLDSDGPKMEEQVVRISLIQRETGGWIVMKEAMEALLTLWLFTLKQRRFKSHGVPDRVTMQPAFVRLIGSNTELTRWDTMRWYVDHCSRVYEGRPMTITEAGKAPEMKTDEIDIEMDRTLGQVMGIEQVDLCSETQGELANEREGGAQQTPISNEPGGGVQQTPISNRATMHWHYFRGRELPQVSDEDWPENRDGQYTSLATKVECSLEELCAQEILFRFFFAIGTFMREERGIRVLGNTTTSYRNTNLGATTSSKSVDANDAAPERQLKAVKFHNSIFERIALEAYQSKVCGSLEEAYQCIIPAFSQTRVLPEVGEVVSSQVTQIFRALVGKGDWIKACDLYNWVWSSMGCKFPHHSNEDLHAIALFTNFVRKLRHEANTGCHGGTLTEQLASKGEAMLKMLTEQEFQGRDVVRALGLILQSLDELDGPMHTEMVGSELIEADNTLPASRRNSQEENDGHGAPEGSEGGAAAGERVHQPNLEADKLELRKMRAELEKLFPLLGFTPSHKSTAHILGADTPVSSDLERDANILDILQRRPLHYAAANSTLEKSTLEFLIEKTDGVDQRDINGNTPLHLAAARNNPNFAAALKKFSLDTDPEMRKKAMVDFNATNELKWTPLHFAAWKGHEDMVDALIKEGAIIDADDIINRSPLHWAAQGGHLNVAKTLIQKRANTKAIDAHGRSPLHVAASVGNGEVAAELADHGARLEDVDKEGKRALDLVIELLEKKRAEKEKAWASLDLSKEEKAAHQAAFAEDIATAFGPLLDTLLVNKEAKAKGWTRLHCAAHKGEAQAVAVLLGLDAKKNAADAIALANQTDHARETALHVAARGGHRGVVDVLILNEHKCNLRINNISGEDALMVAVKNNQLDVVDALLRAIEEEKTHDMIQQVGGSVSPGARPSVAEVPRTENGDNTGMYPLHWAAWNGSRDLVAMLVQRGGVNLRKRDQAGMTAIHYAALMGHDEVVKYLLDESPDLIDAIDKAGDTPLHCAAAGGRVKVVQLLLTHFINQNSHYSEPDCDHRLTAFMNKRNNHRETPLHCAAKGLINAGIEKPVLAYKGVALDVSMWKNLDLATTDWQKTLISRICAVFPRELYLSKITAKDCDSLNQGIRNWQEEFVRLLLRIDDSDTPSVSEECEREVVELLLNNRANIEAPDKDEETPLHLAARWGRLTIAETLLKRLPLPPNQPSKKWEKANVRAEDIHKDTPLHLAARWGHKKMVEVLAWEQAPLEALNNYRCTPCQVAQDHLQFHISDLLKKLISDSAKGLSDSSDSASADSEESVGGVRSAGTSTNSETSSASFANHPNGVTSSGQGPGRNPNPIVYDESSVNILPRTAPPPDEHEEIPTTLTEIDVPELQDVPDVLYSPQQDSGVGTDLSSTALAQSLIDGDVETTSDGDQDLDRGGNNRHEAAVDLNWMWRFPNTGDPGFGVSRYMDSTPEPLSPTSRSPTMPVGPEYSYNLQQESEYRSSHPSRQSTREPRRFSL